MGLPGEFLEVTPDEAENPYTATVATDCGYEIGTIRVEPPFYATDESLDIACASDLGVKIELDFMTPHATLLTFSTEDVEREDVKGAVEYTVSRLLEELGKTASKALFLEGYGIKTNER